MSSSSGDYTTEIGPRFLAVNERGLLVALTARGVTADEARDVA